MTHSSAATNNKYYYHCSLSVLPAPHQSTAGVVLTPSSTHITRQTAKWINVVPDDDTDYNRPDLSRWRAWFKNPKLKSYYSRLQKDEAVLKEARVITEDSNTVEDDSKNKGRRCHCWRYLQLSVDTAARLTLSVNFLLFFLKLAAAIQSGSLAVVSSLIDSTLDLLSGRCPTIEYM